MHNVDALFEDEHLSDLQIQRGSRQRQSTTWSDNHLVNGYGFGVSGRPAQMSGRAVTMLFD